MHGRLVREKPLLGVRGPTAVQFCSLYIIAYGDAGFSCRFLPIFRLSWHFWWGGIRHSVLGVLVFVSAPLATHHRSTGFVLSMMWSRPLSRYVQHLLFGFRQSILPLLSSADVHRRCLLFLICPRLALGCHVSGA